VTPAELTVHLNARVFGDLHAHGETDGVVWDVRPHPRTGRWRVTLALPWGHGAIGRWSCDSEDATPTHAILGRFADAPDAAPVVADAQALAVTR
jgi:hypothetical protein